MSSKLTMALGQLGTCPGAHDIKGPWAPAAEWQSGESGVPRWAGSVSRPRGTVW